MNGLFTSQKEYVIRQRNRLQTDLGDLVVEYLTRSNVFEIIRNPDGQLWAEDIEQGMHFIGEMNDNSAESLLNVVASLVETSITRENPILECELPFYGCRFAGMISPIVESPVFSIRKKAERIFTLEEYLERGIVTSKQVEILKNWILSRKNILVVGGTGSGKTTLINTLMDAIVTLTPKHRLIILEDTLELQCKAKNAVIMRTSDQISMQQLVKATLRHRPDRIIVGEVRGKEALDLLKAWSTGHPGGLATVHANSAEASLSRLEQLIEEATQMPMQSLIARSIDGIVYIEKTPNGRQVKELLSVSGYRGGEYEISPVK